MKLDSGNLNVLNCVGVWHASQKSCLCRGGNCVPAHARRTGGPDKALAHRRLAYALNAQNRFPEAETAFRRAIDLRPNYAPAHAPVSVPC